LAKGQLGDFAGAIADYNRAINLNNNYAKAYYNRGRIRIKTGKTLLAIADYNRGNIKSEIGDRSGGDRRL
jgi:tetratricopeptide (TPR) repeat protein